MSTFTNLSDLFGAKERRMMYTDLPGPVWRDATHACAVRRWLRARRKEVVLRWYDQNQTPSERATWQARAIELTELIRMTNDILQRVFGYRRQESESIPYNREATAAVWNVAKDSPSLAKFLSR